MEMILTGIENKNEYYTNHYFTSIFQDNAEDTIKKWKEKEKVLHENLGDAFRTDGNDRYRMSVKK